MKIPLHVSEATKRLNPDVFNRLGGLRAPESKHHTVSPLVNRNEGTTKGPSIVAIRVGFIVLRKRLLDSDNHVASLKSLRDEIAVTLGIDDADSRITWHYDQLKTTGRQGVVVTIEASHTAR